MQNVLLVGTGRMGRAYAATLKALDAQVIAVGRSADGSHLFEKETGIPTTAGGMTRWTATEQKAPTFAIIAVDVEELSSVTRLVLDAGCTKILVEKPGALTRVELEQLQAFAQEKGASIYIAYNRRFCASALCAQQLIAEDGGVISYTFEFNERIGQKQAISDLGISKRTQDAWFIANSTHVVDLAFYLGGAPKVMDSFASAGPLWAPHPTLFAGAGLTQTNIPFSYYANWELPGPWAITIGTAKKNIILQPIEALAIEVGGERTAITLDTKIDTQFKPGLYEETKRFLSGGDTLMPLADQIAQFPWFEKMLNNQ